MNQREAGFLLLTSQLGDPGRKPLTVAQFRTLAARVRGAVKPEADREMTVADLAALGYSADMATRILSLLADQEQLDYYLQKAKRAGCIPLTRAGKWYPARVRKCLGDDSPGCLWAKGDVSLLRTPCVALVGSRDLREENRSFARDVGIQAAKQGFTLVSGNARGADQTAQNACLEAGGKVICVVADSLEKQKRKDSVLWLSEECFNGSFSAHRALSRNRVIHSLGRMTFAAQASLRTGGTWDGTVKNLMGRWSSVFCFDDGSKPAIELGMMGAQLIKTEQLMDLDALYKENGDLFLAL